MGRVRAAADFAADAVHGVHLDLGTVFALKQADRAARFRFVHGHFGAGDGDIPLNCVVDERLHGGNLFRSELAREAEVKAQTLGGDVAAFLGDVVILEHMP
ncbi:hypothetical protein SDC9_95363 [bioreactor metagenome]|uniref:Uncharacterized protein n=1 Tax=bioreactor metagenome TaxID=1076179 RepID=A0A645A6E0_9ZZZZ